MDIQTIDKIIYKHNYDESMVIGMLQDIQKQYYYIPEEAMLHLSDRLSIPVSKLYHIATFYKAFSLTPKGRHIIQVCTGTACHVRGASQLLAALERELNIKVEGTTEDRCFSLETVRCIGCCSLAPVMKIDDEIYGKLTSKTLKPVLLKYRG